jgi:hypothetical protein
MLPGIISHPVKYSSIAFGFKAIVPYPDPPKGGALALTQALMGKGRRTIQARFQ